MKKSYLYEEFILVSEDICNAKINYPLNYILMEN